jgi:hypothetical protein
MMRVAGTLVHAIGSRTYLRMEVQFLRAGELIL